MYSLRLSVLGCNAGFTVALPFPPDWWVALTTLLIHVAPSQQSYSVA